MRRGARSGKVLPEPVVTLRDGRSVTGKVPMTAVGEIVLVADSAAYGAAYGADVGIATHLARLVDGSRSCSAPVAGWQLQLPNETKSPRRGHPARVEIADRSADG